MVRVMLLAALAAVASAVLSAPVQVTAIVNPPVMTRGVNLGNWFILEPYLGNSVFGGSDAPDEWSLCQELGTDACRQRLTDHWNSWVTQADLQKIKDAGLNSVRIPIGFWSVELRGNEPYVDGQIPVLQKVLGWCKDIGLTALIDLHGVVAGQSANLDTGHQQDREYWTEYDGDHSITLRMLGKLTQAITPYLQANGGPVIGIEGCNEPDRDQVPHDWLADYYTQAYSVVRGNTSGADIEYFYMDQFSPTAWQGFLDGSPNVYQDTHQYFAWSGIDPNNYWNAMGLLCGQSASDVRTVSGQRWLVVGEWALTVGGNPDWTDDYKVFLTQFAQTQINIWETGGGGGQGGWYYWNFKTEGGGQNTWDYFSLLDMNIMPNMNNGVPPNHCAGYWASAEGQRFSTYLNETNMDPAAVQLRAVLADPGKLTHLAKKEMEVMKRNFNKNFNERNNLSKDSKHATKHHNNKPRHHVHNSLRRVHNSKP